jgi:hypothetical protein
MLKRRTETHTPASSEKDRHFDHCVECSEIAKDWVSWPCSREKLVKAAVARALEERSYDEAEELEEAYRQGYLDGRKPKKRVKRARRALLGP